MRLEGKTAIVTGGGRGIGRAIALALATEGANVSVCARTAAEIEAVAGEIRRLGRAALTTTADLTMAEQAAALVERTQATFGGIDILINNAGGLPSELYDASGSLPMGEIWEMDEALWDRAIESNLKSVFLCTKAVMPSMIARGGGNIVNIASAMGHGAWPIGGPYMVAKHGVVALTQSLGLTAAKHGVRVNAVSPGLIDTPGQRRFFKALGMPEANFPPMEPPEPVAAAVLYLLCDTPPGMTGQALQLFGTCDMTFDHASRAEAPDAYAPDGSEIRLLVANSAASMCEVCLPPGMVSTPVRHRTVQEIWYVLEGEGEVWRQSIEGETRLVSIQSGSALTIPLGCPFQFRCTGTDDLRFLCITTPPWPGEHEAIVEPDQGAWPLPDVAT